jgi:hypothetical protein
MMISEVMRLMICPKFKIKQAYLLPLPNDLFVFNRATPHEANSVVSCLKT